MAEYDPNVDQFDLARKRASQQINAGVQNQQDALKRRFAAMGALNSGAAINLQNQTAEKGQEQLQSANEGINAQQGQELQRQKEVKEGRDFQTSERLGSQGFAAEQAGLGRNFQADQAEIQRKWSTGERLSAQDYQGLQAGLQRAFQESQFGRQLQQAKDQFDQQFGQQKQVDQWNYELGNKALDQKGWMDALLGPSASFGGGFLGQVHGGISHYTGL